jgi:hypothetical protein
MKSLFLAASLVVCACGTNLDPPKTEGAGGASTAQELAQDTTSLWQHLTADQRQQIQQGLQVVVTVDTGDVLDVTAYQWVHHNGPKANPEGAAAVFWDLEAFPSYFGQEGVVTYDVIEGQGTSSLLVSITAPSQAGTLSYPEEVTLYRVGNARYSILFHTTVFDQGPVPGAIRVFSGSGRFQSFPGDGGGTLMAYETAAILTPAAAANAGLKQSLAQLTSGIAAALVGRLEQGPSDGQLHRLRHALGN